MIDRTPPEKIPTGRPQELPGPTRGEQLGPAIPLVAVGACCAATAAGGPFGAGLIALTIWFFSGLSMLAVPLAFAAFFLIFRSRRSPTRKYECG